MAEIKIHRPHRLGLAKARAVAWQWAEQVEQQFSMECTVIEGQTTDTVEFQRPGVTGQLAVAADHYTLEAQLGFLLGAFGPTIQAEIEKHLDALLAREAATTPPAAKKAASPSAAKKAAARKASRT